MSLGCAAFVCAAGTKIRYVGETWRASLSWANFFGPIPNAINYYSRGEEVLANPTAEMGIPSLLSPDYAWYNQEIRKGERLSFGLLSSDDRWAPFGNNEAGWNMEGTAYEKPYPLTGGLLTRPYSPEEAAGIPDSALRYAPFFGAFDNGEIVTDAGSQFLREHPEVCNRILADGIPAESFAAGANGVWLENGEASDRNREMYASRNGYWPEVRKNEKAQELSKKCPWLHSDLKDVAYPFVRHVFLDIKETIDSSM